MKLTDIFEDLAAMKQQSVEQGEKLGALEAKLKKAKERVRNVGKKDTFINRSRGRLTGRGRGTAAADQSLVQK